VSGKRLYITIAAAAALVHLGVLWNDFVLDDLTIILANPLVHSLSGVWQAFGSPYFPAAMDVSAYRPLTVATYALDWGLHSTTWFHAVNLFWHVGASVMVAVLARRWAGEAAGLVAGLVFAVHPAHVEAIANVVGRNELMAAVFTLLAVYAALERRSVLWSAAAMAAGLLSKENAIVAPGLITWAWLLGVRPAPPRRHLAVFVTSWLVLAAGYLSVRWVVLHGFLRGPGNTAPVFLGQDPLTIQLTAFSALGDAARLLVFPLSLSADYSPDHRAAVHSALDGRFLFAVVAVALWLLLLGMCWRRGRKVEAFGLGWIAIAYSPVANLLFQIQILIAERTLYLPSVGIALAAGAAARGLAGRRLAAVAALLFVLGGARSALRVPAWRDQHSVALALIRDAPRSYFTWRYVGWDHLWAGRYERAIPAFRAAIEIFPYDARVYISAAHAEYALHRPVVAESLLVRADTACKRCVTLYRGEAFFSRMRGDTATSDWLTAHAQRLLSTP
jgi:tetratricopeptide (TPR) repeat protein